MRLGVYQILLVLVSSCLTPAYSTSIQHLERRSAISAREPNDNAAPAKPAELLSIREATIPSSEDRIDAASIARDLADGKGTKDAPVDGQDGRPHAGPFVETAAERDRKKAKDKGEDAWPTSGRKPGPKDTSASYDTDLPTTNDGVMDDRNREGPKEGTRGTEGGISEKYEKQRLDSMSGKEVTKTPAEPKQAPPLPHSEQEKLSESKEKEYKSSKESKSSKQDTKPSEGKVDQDETEDSETGGLKKPDDLPDKPHSIPHPIPNSGAKDDPLSVKPSTSFPGTAQTEQNGLIQPLHSFALAFTMIIFSEIGDKTFLVAALMAMKHPPLLVLSAAFPALVTMTVLSAVLGHTLPTLLPVRFTGFLAAILFFVFGLKLLREGYAMRPDEGVGDEMREVEMELEEKEAMARKLGRRRSSITPYMLEAARGPRKSRSESRLPAPPDSPPSSPDGRSPSPSAKGTLNSVLTGASNLCSLLLSPAWVQTFAMTFLGEWGDRSQIATIAMAAGQDYWWVTTGALVGHFLCTVIAVLGGRAIAGRVSMRVVTLGGAFAFLAFGVVYLAESLYYR